MNESHLKAYVTVKDIEGDLHRIPVEVQSVTWHNAPQPHDLDATLVVQSWEIKTPERDSSVSWMRTSGPQLMYISNVANQYPRGDAR